MKNNWLHKYYVYHQNSSLHFSEVPHPIAEILLKLFGWIGTQCHLQLETTGCWVVLTFFFSLATWAGKDSSWGSSVVRGTHRAGSFLFMLCFHRVWDIFHNINLQSSHTWEKNGLVMVGTERFTAAVCGFFRVMGMTLVFSEVLLLPFCWLMMIVPYS